MTTRGFEGTRPEGEAGGRVPPGQSLTSDFPVLSAGPTPKVKIEDWRFTVKIGPRPVKSWTWKEFNELPRTKYKRDIHCVTTWSKLDTKWSGVLFDDIMAAAGVEPPTPYTLLHSFDGYSTNVPVVDLSGGKAMVATHFAGQALSADHGGPARMIVPHLYFWKSAKWINGIQFTNQDTAGFWELRGYHMYGDPWREQRFSGDDSPSLGADRSANVWRQATIESVIGETASTKTYRLRPSAWISFLAGQHIEVQLTAADGYRANRFYSIGSTPDAVGTYDITVDRLKHGEVSSWFHEVARPGDTIELRGPFGGHFVWRDTDKGPLLLVAGGSGIVPIMSIIRHRAHVAPDTPAVLLYGARTMDDLIFADELVRREQWEPHFSTVFAFSRGKAQRDTDFSRRIDSEIIGAALARLPSRPALTFVCGSNAFAESVSAMIADSGVPPGTIRVERFGE